MRIEIRRLLLNTWALEVFVLLMGLISVMPNAVQAQNTEENKESAVHAMTFTQLQGKFYKADIKNVISVDVHELTLEQALRVIARETGLKLSYRGDIMVNKMISLHEGSISISDALAIILENTGLDYKISQDGYLLITEKANDLLNEVMFQDIVRGTVVDARTGESLPGVTILVKGTNIGTTTDFDGNFELNVTSLDETLIFSYIGYQTEEVPLEGRSEIEIIMEQIVVVGGEMVVTGYGMQRRSEITESISSIRGGELDVERSTRIEQALQGKIPGVSIKQTSGEPGSGMKVRIRGSKSIQGNNAPIYVVDGIVVDDISNMDVGNISSIEVLKDASATAIYGSRGSNGVILVSTKRGYDGEGILELNSSYGIQSVRNKLDMMNAAEFARTVNADRIANGNIAQYSEEEIRNLEKTGGVNYQDELFRVAPIQSHRLSYSGGGNDVRYYISGNFQQQDGIVISQDYKRFNLRSNIDYRYSEQFNIAWNSQMTLEERNGFAASVSNGLPFNPTIPIRDSEGNYNLRSSIGSNTVNQLAIANENELENKDYTISSNLTFNYNFTDNLTLNVIAGVNYFTFNRNNYSPLLINAQGIANFSSLGRLSLQNSNRLTYQNNFKGRHNVKADLIYEEDFRNSAGENINARNFPTDATTFKIKQIANDVQVNSNYQSEKLRSFVSRVNYSFDEKYILTGTVRVDGTSKFRKGNRYGVFPALSLAWLIDREPFISELNIFDEFKLRASYGVTGNQSVSSNSTRAPLSTASSLGYSINGGAMQSGIGTSSRLSNPDLVWEESNQVNLGLDLSFFNSSIDLTIDVYKTKTNDLLQDVLLPGFTGVNIITKNIGKMENKGAEISLGAALVRTTDFQLNAGFNISANRNKVTDLGGEESILPDNIFAGSFTNQTKVSIVQVGHPLGVFQGYIFEGIYQAHEAEEAAIYNKRPGDIKFKDLNNDGIINEDDFGIIGGAEPDFIFGISSSLRYKNLDMSVLVQGVYGGEIYNLYRGNMYGWGGAVTRDPGHKDVLDYWTPDNPSNKIPAFGPTRDGFLLSSQFLEDASYVRLKNLTIGYTLNNILGLTSMRVYANAENLLTITNYSGFDPELSSGGSSDTDENIDFSPYPMAKTFMLGLGINF